MSRVIIYTTTHCPYCVNAKKLFTRLNQNFEEITLDDKTELRQKLSKENNGWRTVPMIFIDEKFYGGFDDINQLYKNGELQKILGIAQISSVKT